LSAAPAPAAAAALIAAAAELAREAGQARPVALAPLAGGKNNRVYRLDLEDGARLALKAYFADPRDPRDRLGAEWAFLRHAWARGVRDVPEPLARDEAARLGLYGFLPGRKLQPGEVTAAHVAAAADFVVAVNGEPRDPEALQPGSEACFALGEHLATVERRVARLGALDPDAPLRAEAERFVQGRLAPAWRGTRERVESAAAARGLALDAPLPARRAIASPSDFGFHNALVDGERVGFLDFEYAGRDDPAKLASDLFCCPEVPVPAEHHAAFVERLAAGLGLGAEDVWRCRLLLDAYRVKWACIVLNDFLPVGAARRAFADGPAREARAAAQLGKAEAIIAPLA
jgi:hypothetical protein